MKTKEDIIKWIEDNQHPFVHLADKIWANPELAFHEFKASRWQADFLAAEGFEINWDIGGLTTAFEAHWGQGKPKIGFVGEYDALAGLSQKIQPTPEPISAGAPGHGCGHNLLGTGAVMAAVAVKKWLEANNRSGSVSYYGCPAEERGSGKTYMVADGAFADVDAAFNFHPGRHNRPETGATVGVLDVNYRFTGIAAHAGGAPHKGRSALDAVELMNVGVNYLREHVTDSVRMQYVIKNGGEVPNIVPAEAEVWYFLKAHKMEELQEVARRVYNVAKGAALMTGTKVEQVINSGCSSVLNNLTLADLQYQAMERIGPIKYTEQELAFAEQINASYPKAAVKGLFDEVKLPQAYEDQKAALKEIPLLGINLEPPDTFEIEGGATDVGDVSRNTPLCMMYVTCYTTGGQSHSWSSTATCGMSIGHKGMLHAAKIMAIAALDLYLDPMLLQKIQKEFNTAVKEEPYISPIAPDSKAPYVDNPMRSPI